MSNPAFRIAATAFFAAFGLSVAAIFALGVDRPAVACVFAGAGFVAFVVLVGVRMVA